METIGKISFRIQLDHSGQQVTSIVLVGDANTPASRFCSQFAGAWLSDEAEVLLDSFAISFNWPGRDEIERFDCCIEEREHILLRNFLDRITKQGKGFEFIDSKGIRILPSNSSHFSVNPFTQTRS